VLLFTQTDPKSAKRQSSLQYLIALLGYPLVNAAHKTLKKSTPVSGFQGKKQTWQFSTPSSCRKKMGFEWECNYS
jgi:hypothetical protein